MQISNVPILLTKQALTEEPYRKIFRNAVGSRRFSTTAAAPIHVGLLTIRSICNVNWEHFTISGPASLTLAVSHSISYGIVLGLISHIIISVFCGNFRKIRLSAWIISALFIAMLILTH